MFRKALLVGISHYPQGLLPGCVEDVRGLYPLLSRHADGKPNFECRALVSEPGGDSRFFVSKALLEAQLEQLFLEGEDSCELALFYFSGHGLACDSGGFLVTQDGTGDSPGLEMGFLMALVNTSSVREVVIVLDCCFAGAIRELEGEGDFDSSNRSHYLPFYGHQSGLSILASSQARQASIGGINGSRFSSILRAGLKGGAADLLGEVSVASLFHFSDRLLGAFEQRPFLNASISQMTVLRHCIPLIGVDKLRLLHEYFKGADSLLQLGPAYEPTAEPRDIDKEAVFRDLQLFFSVGLVRPIEETHMYFAAIRGKKCALTEIGKYYWLLGKEGRI